MKFSLYGRTFEVVAVFPDTEEGVNAANAFMQQHDTGPRSGPSLLAQFQGELILANCEDRGVGTDSVHENPHWVER